MSWSISQTSISKIMMCHSSYCYMEQWNSWQYFVGTKRAFSILCSLLQKAHTENIKTKTRSLFRKKYKSNLFPVAFQNSFFNCMVNDLLSLKKKKNLIAKESKISFLKDYEIYIFAEFA